MPTYHVHNDCDIAGICPNGELLRSQLQRIRVLFTDVIIDSSMQQVSACLDACGTNPDGDTRFEDNPRGFTEGSRNHTLPASATYTPPAPTATPVGMKSCPAPEP